MRTLLIISTTLLLLLSACSQQTDQPSEVDFSTGWEFSLNDEAWRPVTIPHDWSVEFPFDSINGEGCTGYLPGGMGKYQKKFPSSSQPVTYLLFDGVYNRATVSLNEQEVGFHPFGYAPIYYDISEQLNPAGQENNLLVEVDRSRYADSRWYTGSGIYREVRLLQEPALHVPPWGISVTTPEVSATTAEVRVETKLVHKGARTQDARLVTELVDAQGKIVTAQTSSVSLEAGAVQTVVQELALDNPELWDTKNPNLYTANSRIEINDQTTREYETTFGVRSFRFDAATGFYLNGVNQKIKGVCLHHDGGSVGAAVPKAVWRRRLQTLKDGGCNAIRSAHNPASDEFLDLCDEMGFFVQDEFYDEWDFPKDKRKNMGESTSTDYITRGHHEHFQEWAKIDLQNTILSHRNHPSIIQWSIGNEIEWTYPRQKETTGFFGADANGNYFWNPPPYSTDKIRELQETLPRHEYHIGETAQKLADWTREIDTTRPVIANCILPSASYESGYAKALDIIGFSYRRIMYDYAKENYPNLPVMGTENLVQYHEWKAVMERPWISGTFLWTGIDYMGESNGQWPRKQTPSGMLDLAGFPKPSYYMMQSLWSEEPMIYATTQKVGQSIYKLNDAGQVVERKPGKWKRALWSWHKVNHHWNYPEKELVIVEALSNCPEAELFLNGKSLGRQRIADYPDHIYKWAVPYDAGKVEVRGYQGKTTVDYTLETAEAPAKIALSTEADDSAVVHVVVQLEDDQGHPVRHDERELTFTVEGAKLLGVDSGASTFTYPFQGGKANTNGGKALGIVQLQGQKATVTVSGPGLTEATITL